ncbi:cysteine desulfurase [Alteromonas sp. 5E99-2]|uniref:aminotransferase class V-fold PLP-dependent enzyme n=1 Tax=Alteromonas sp. 5E99-2 TaxID=2817683 RepID=UPI001A980E42|nr:cysteine desulfurase [Alteromonas sp. 5E99-2]MBO1256157.1 cysteine desulfurase [Alteromonas sp. 5E99-2]
MAGVGRDVHSKAISQFSYYQNSGNHYLDSAATTQKPDSVIDAVTQGYRHFCAPVHRGSYPLSEVASSAYETARSKVAQFINASAQQLIFTKSCTESINHVALGWAKSKIKPGHKIWISQMEHNANYLPWLQLCKETGAELKIIEIDSEGHLQIDQTGLWDDSTFLIALTHCSNILGGETPVQEVCDKARNHGIYTLIDAAQSVSHIPIDVKALGCDFLAFSAHKMYGPEGIGALYIDAQRQLEMSPLLLGGGSIESVSEQQIRLREAPHCFEAGSPNLSGALGFAAAVDFLQAFPQGAISCYVGNLGQQFRQALAKQNNITLLPVAGGGNTTSVVSFVVEGVHPHDMAQTAADNDVSIRTGSHCSHLLMSYLKFGAVNRLSLGIYNHSDDIQPLIESINAAADIFA